MNDKKLILSCLLVATMAACRTAIPVAEHSQLPSPAVVTDVSTQQTIGRAQQHWGYRKDQYNAEIARPFRLIHTRLELRPDWQRQHLHGKALLQMSPYFYAQQQVVLDAVGFEIKAVGLADAQGKRFATLLSTYNGRQLTVQLDRSYGQGEQIYLYVDYVAKPNELLTNSGKGLYFINPLGNVPGKSRQLWTQGQTQTNSCWFPTFDSPNVKTTQELLVTVEQGMVSVSNGKLVGQHTHPDGTRTDHWKQDKPHAPYLFALAVGDFAVVRDEWRGKEVSYYVDKAYKGQARQLFARTPEMLEFFSKRLGYDYPWDKYAQVVVRDFSAGGMENTGVTILTENMQTDDAGIRKMGWDDLIAHELFHQWFGDLITCESWANLTLNEAFATYSEYLWREYKNGKTDASYLQQQHFDAYMQESRNKQVPLIRYVHKNAGELFDRHSYQKGGLVLHYLRSVLGDEAFFASVNRYLQQRAFSTGEIGQLRTAFEETVGQDLHWFFDPWFMQAGHPILQVTDRYEGGQLVVEVRQQQDMANTPLYRLPLALDVWQDGKATRHQVVVDDTLNTFTFPVDRAPELVLLDPDRALPGEIISDASAERLRYTVRNVPNLRHRLEALDTLASGTRLLEVLARTLDDPYWGIRKKSVEICVARMNAELGAALMPRLQIMAREDSSMQVRAVAVGALAKVGKEALPLIKQATRDNSQTVQAEALVAYARLGGTGVAELYSRYEEVNHPGIVRILATYYAEQQVSGKADWFVAKLRGAQESYAAGILFKLVGQYAQGQSPQVQRQLAEELMMYTQQTSGYRVRIGAYKTLSTFKDPEVRAKVQQLRESETHPEVLKALGTIEG